MPKSRFLWTGCDFFRDEGDGSATVVCPHCGKPVTVELK